jgi:hypothetical protein
MPQIANGPGSRSPRSMACPVVPTHTSPKLMAVAMIEKADGPQARTTSETATNCVAAAATTSRWKISWKPNQAGAGFGHVVA